MNKAFYLSFPFLLISAYASEKGCLENFLCPPKEEVQEMESLAARRVYAHLHLADTASASQEAELFLQKAPNSKLMHRALIRALSLRGEEVKALEQYERSSLLFEELKNDPSLVEEIAWGILQKGQGSAQAPIKILSLLGACFTSDVRAIPILLKHLRDSNAYMRALAAKCSSMLGDDILKEELLALLQKEKVWYVRLSIIDSLGKMKVQEAFSYLQEIVMDPQTIAEERGAAIVALALLYEKVDSKEIAQMARSPRAGIRELACQIIMHFSLKEESHFLLGLLEDPSPYVRMAALNALGYLRLQMWKGKPLWDSVRPCLQDSDPTVQITAGWLGCLLQEEEGLTLLKNKIAGDMPEERRLAAGALAVTGKFGKDLASSLLKACPDPYVGATLAMGLIGQRTEVELASEKLYQLLEKEKELWMWESHYNPFFRSIAPSKVRHIQQVPQYPAMVDQFVRLEVISILSIMQHPKAEEATKEFLKTRSWGITSSAAALLIQEGGEESLPVVKNLMQDPDEKVRIQAALVLAMVGNDYSAIEVLKSAYPHVDRELKIHILEAIAHIGDPSCVPFLLNVLSEPFQTLRMIAASAIVQCLRH